VKSGASVSSATFQASRKVNGPVHCRREKDLGRDARQFAASELSPAGSQEQQVVSYVGERSGAVIPGWTVVRGQFGEAEVVGVPLTVGVYTGKLCAAVSATRVRLLQKCAIDSMAFWE
jgi:hypothetical protein